MRTQIAWTHQLPTDHFYLFFFTASHSCVFPECAGSFLPFIVAMYTSMCSVYVVTQVQNHFYMFIQRIYIFLCAHQFASLPIPVWISFINMFRMYENGKRSITGDEPNETEMFYDYYLHEWWAWKSKAIWTILERVSCHIKSMQQAHGNMIIWIGYDRLFANWTAYYAT